MTEHHLRAAALSYAKLGWHVFPVHWTEHGRCSCGKTQCTKPGKHPITKNGLYDATVSEDQIIKWWSLRPLSNIGIRTGEASKIIVIDVDNKPDLNKYGSETLKSLEKQHYPLPDTIEAISPSGGRHIYFNRPNIPTIKNSVEFVPAIDVRADGGYIIAPPSSIFGKTYSWEASSDPADMKPSNIPDWLLKLITSTKSLPADKKSTKSESTIKEGSRNSTLTSAAGLMHSKNLDEETVLKIISEMNLKQCNPPLPESEVNTIVKSVCSMDRSSSMFNEPPSDSWNAKILLTLAGSDIRWCDELGGWFKWTGVYWERVEEYRLYSICQKAADYVFKKSFSCQDEAVRSAYIKHSFKMKNERGINSMLKLLKGETGISAKADQFDTHPFLLNCKNGTLNLETGEFYEGRRNDMLTQCCDVYYDPEAKCPEWLKFLNSIFENNQELIDLIHRALGYSLSGNIKEDCMFFFYGEGSNGKTTLLKHVLNILGNYAGTIPPSTLMESQNDSALNDVAGMRGKRFIYSVESDESKKLSESRVKQLTGSDPITARFLYHEYFQFYATFKIYLATNNMPTIGEYSEGIWRRIVCAPFNRQYLGDDKDPLLDQKLSSEYPGILIWMVEGFKLWRKHSLGSAKIVKDFVDKYRNDNDIIGIYIKENCEIAKEDSFKYEVPQVLTSHLWGHFKAWNKKFGGRFIGRNSFYHYFFSKLGIKISQSSCPEIQSRNVLRGVTFTGAKIDFIDEVLTYYSRKTTATNDDKLLDNLEKNDNLSVLENSMPSYKPLQTSTGSLDNVEISDSQIDLSQNLFLDK